MRPVLTLAAAAVCAVGLAACGSDGSTISTPTVAGGADTDAPQATAPAESTQSAAPAGCRKVAKPKARSEKAKKPTAPLPSGKTYTVVLRTSCGEIDIRLDTANDPKTAASFAALAKSGFYDRLIFHRIVSGFVIQTGDPKGTGTGDAGYRVVERPPSSTAYRKGVVAMAKGGQEAAGTSSSQFFIVSGPDAGLPPDYAVAGKVTKGLDVVARIAAVPTTADPASGEQSVPTTPVVVEKATLRTS